MLKWFNLFIDKIQGIIGDIAQNSSMASSITMEAVKEADIASEDIDKPGSTGLYY